MADYASIFHQIVDIWEKQISQHVILLNAERGCITTDYAKDPNRAYQQVRIKGSKYYVHIIAAMLHNEHPPFLLPNGMPMEASHLCGDPRCVNIEHLWLEAADINKSRCCCLLFRQQPVYRCPHLPVCIGFTSLYDTNVLE